MIGKIIQKLYIWKDLAIIKNHNISFNKEKIVNKSININENYFKISFNLTKYSKNLNIIKLFYLFLILLIPQSYLSEKIELRNLNYDNIIILTINRDNYNNHLILSEEFDSNLFPNKIKINGNNEITGNIQRSYGLNSEINTVKLTWNGQITSCRNMFKQVPDIISIDLTSFDFSSVTDMGSFFDQCWEVESINMKNGNATNVQNMEWMFSQCYNLISIDFTNFKTENLITMEGMFYNCEKLQSIDLSNFQTINLTNMNQTFTNNYVIESLDLSSFYTPSLITMSQTFFNCKKLQSLNVENFDTSLVTNMYELFTGCEELTSLNLSNFYTPKLETMAHMFFQCYNLEYLDIGHFNTSKIQDMALLFKNCSKIKYLNLSNFDTSSVSDMAEMFQNCFALTSIDINNFNAESAWNMGHMFTDCRALTFLNLSHFNTPNLQYIDYMFYNCISVKILIINNFNTTSVNNYEKMFYNMASLISLNLINFRIFQNNSNVNMFFGINPDVILCYNESQVSSYFLEQISAYNNSCKYICEMESRIYIKESDECVDNCYSSQSIYIYEYGRKCYSVCPTRTKFYNDTKICEDCRDYYNYEQTGCIDTIDDGYYNNDSIAKTIDVCPIECKTCSLDSVNKSLCLLCNNDGEYYFKSDDVLNIGSFHKCYYKDEVQTDYYLDVNIYKPCYSLCKTCYGDGNNDNHNCELCYNDDIYELKDRNCICRKYYNYERTACINTIDDGYYNNDTNARTIDKCPDKCVTCTLSSINDNNKCTSCNINNGYYPKYNEMTNTNYECYQEPQTYYYLDNTNNMFKQCHSLCETCNGDGNDDNNLCTKCKDEDIYNLKNGNCICKKYYNYEKTECINSIDDGYYNNDTDARTIDICPIKCKTCSLESVNDNLCFLCNNDEEYYHKSDDPLNTGSFHECYHIDEVKIDYYLDSENKIFKPCYVKCKTCNGEGTNENNNCLECKEGQGFSLIDGNCNYSELIINSSENISNIDYIDIITDITTTYVNLNKTEVIKKKIEQLINENSKTNDENRNNTESKEGNAFIEFSNIKDEKYKEKYNNDKITIDLGNCENILKHNYNISNNDSLYILKLIVNEEGMKIPKVEYEVYYKTFNLTFIKLNLEACRNTKIGISIPVTIDDDIDKYNPNSKYYNDICSKATSDFGTDITLEDRKNEFIDKNMTLCEENCDLISYNFETKKVKCSCDAKIYIPLIEDIKFDKNELYNSFIDIEYIINIEIMKCYKDVFNKSLIHNIGFFVILFIVLLFIISIIIFSKKSYPILKKDINDIIIALKRKNQYTQNKSKIIKKKIKDNKKKIIKKSSKLKSLSLNKLNNLSEDNNPVKENIFKKDIIEFTTDKNFDNNQILEYKDFEVNLLEYKIALKSDKRSYLQFYISLLKIKHLVIFSFWPIKDYNSQIIKIFLFFFFFTIHLTVNALFFNDSTMHKIYVDKDSYNYVYQIPQILYSSLISGVINSIIKFLSLSQENISKLKKEKEIEKERLVSKGIQLLNSLKSKFVLFFIITFIILLFCLYYISCFCGIYVNTQIHLIKDSCFSFLLSFLYPFLTCLIPGIFRIKALKDKKGSSDFLYKLSYLILMAI